ncbi:MAG: hypothetical protein N2C14_24325 [Planctomycetales bacterium]
MLQLIQQQTSPRRLAAWTLVLFLSVSSVARAQTEWREEVESLRQTVDARQRSIEEQEQRLAEQQRTLDDLENRPDDRPPADWENESVVGYDGGFVIAGSNGGLDTGGLGYRMRIQSWGQLRHNLLIRTART